MGLLEIRSDIKFLNPPDPRRKACVRAQPECVVLPVAAGVPPAARPPVRIFLGTEPGQHRAERVFVWSIEQNRNPARVYEIHLMKDLAGFDRRGWTTGFTNYRFAVPHLAGCRGRAIFNDVDEAYFADPAELFDADLSGHGYLSTSDTETSVMLMDCERMAAIWPLESCRGELKKQLLARTLARHPDIRGDLPPAWTARDEEFVPGFSKLQHWTTLHTQPWRPVPDRFVYRPNPTGQLWFELKRGADAAGYQVFTRSRPSSLFRALRERLRNVSRPAPGGAQLSASARRLREVIEQSGARSLVDYGLGGRPDDTAARLGLPDTLDVAHFDLAASTGDGPSCDGVVCEHVLEFLPDEDVPWVVDDLFARAERFVFATIHNETRSERLDDGSTLVSHPRDTAWWQEHFDAAGRRHPALHWTLAAVDRDQRGHPVVRVRDGGLRARGTPSVWVLTDACRESTAQALALADALGWPYQCKELHFGALGRLRGRIGLDRSRSARLAPPWPDVVVTSGLRCSRVAQWIRDRDEGRTRLVQVGYAGGEVASSFAATVTPKFSHLWPHPTRVETTGLLAPPTSRSSETPARRLDPFAAAPRPRVALVFDATRGGRPSAAAVTHMGEQVLRFAEEAGGSLRAVTGLGVRRELVSALAAGIGGADRIRTHGSDGGDDVLDAADVIVVAGNDAFRVSETASRDQPVYIYPLRDGGFRPGRQFRERVARLASSRPTNRRGTTRPQQGLEYLGARLVERGIVVPPQDLGELHQELYRLGVAMPFGAPLRPGPQPALREAERAAEEVRAILGYPAAHRTPALTDPIRDK